MADIFGRKSALDYAHYKDLAEKNGQDHVKSYIKNSASLNNYNTYHDFNALGKFYGQKIQIGNDDQPQVLGYLTDSLQAMQAMVEETFYTEFRADQFIPVKQDGIPEGATTYGVTITDRFGESGFISNDGSQALNSTVSQRKVSYPIELGGNVAYWNAMDVISAMTTGVALDDETIRTATQAALQHIEAVWIGTGDGDNIHDFKGLINQETHATQTDKVILTDATATIKPLFAVDNAFRNPLKLIRALQDEITKFISGTQEIFGRNIRSGMTIYLPLEQYANITNTVMTEFQGISTWDYLSTRNLWTKMTGEALKIVPVMELNLIDGTNDRMIIGLNNPRVMEAVMPMAPNLRFINSTDYGYKAPMWYRIGGLQVKRPDGLRYYTI